MSSSQFKMGGLTGIFWQRCSIPNNVPSLSGNRGRSEITSISLNIILSGIKFQISSPLRKENEKILNSTSKKGRDQWAPLKGFLNFYPWSSMRYTPGPSPPTRGSGQESGHNPKKSRDDQRRKSVIQIRRTRVGQFLHEKI